MKKTARLLAFVLGCIFLISCGSKDYNNQPWMPSSTKGKHSPNSSGGKKAHHTQKSHSRN